MMDPERRAALVESARKDMPRFLELARYYIEHGWVQGVSARDLTGKSVGWHSDEASCFCIQSACARTIYNDGANNKKSNDWTVGYSEMLSVLLKALPPSTSLVKFNDAPGRTQADVLALFDKVMANEERRDG